MFKRFIKKMNNLHTPSIEGKGFTLIELLLVIVLIGILSGFILSVVNVSGLRARSRDAQRSGDLKKIQTALELYFADNRGYPLNSGGWAAITTAGASVLRTALRGTYTQNLPQDPRSGEAMTASCGIGNYNYYYRTDTCAGAGCLAGKYVLMTFMESQSAAATSTCSSLVNCGGAVSGCNCAAPCYGVESPL